MATLITCRNLSKSYAGRPLFTGLSIAFDDAERTGLIGPNGAGKSTLLRILAGLAEPDDGEVHVRRGLRVAYVPQDEQFPPGLTAHAALLRALDGSTLDEHDRETRAAILLDQLEFRNPQQPVAELSGGWKKRLSIAAGLIREPDLLLLDEPTNHLDLASVLWLEELLLRTRVPFIVVTHDRYFLQDVVSRMVELSPAYPDGCYSVDGSYQRFLEKRAEFLAGQKTTQAAMASRARREIAFLESNSHALLDDLADIKARNNLNLAAGIAFDASGRQTRKLIAAKGISKSLGGRLLFSDVDLLLAPGTRLGLLGANGSGKTTLIRTLIRALEPDTGEVQHAADLKIVLFDQQRATLPRELPLREALAGKLDFVEYAGQKTHVNGWAERFLFRNTQLNTPVGELSGGEQARILIARLMLQPADVLILDEPTNDLDIPSLDVLEESLTNFPGAVILVSHDRFMLERVSTKLLVLLGDGKIGRYGSLPPAEAALRRAIVARDAAARPAEAKNRAAAAAPGGSAAPAPAKARPAKLTFKEQKELEGMEAAIAKAEADLAAATAAASDPKIATNHVELAAACAAMEKAQAEVDRLYARWSELEAKREAAGA
jgi:ATP-binding cassette subfamily F protein uup